MTTSQHILACIDGSAVTESVCDYAAWYASKLNLPVALLHVSEVPASTRRDLSGAIGVNSRQFLLEELTQLDEQRAKVVNSYSNALVQDAKAISKVTLLKSIFVSINVAASCYLPLSILKQKIVPSSWDAEVKITKAAVLISVAKSKPLPAHLTFLY